MFVIKKLNIKRTILIVSFSVVLLIVLIATVATNGPKNITTTVSGVTYSLQAEDNLSQVEFLEQFGWVVNEEPSERGEIVIPQEFNETYQNYNEMQINQGLDLSDYQGKTCMHISFQVLNYPNYQDEVYANLLIFEGNVIGGDIACKTLNGFMHGFEKIE